MSDNKNKNALCSECGEKIAVVKGMCKKCYYKHWRKSNGKSDALRNETCKICGSHQIYCKNMCQRCYALDYYSKTHPDYSPGKTGPKPKAQTEKVFTLLKCGMKQSEIARSIGVSRQRVSQIVKNRERKV